MAYKYPAVEEPTVIEDIEYNIGKTGRLSIRARLTPVEVDGSVVEYASLHNVGHLQAADLRIGDTVSAFRANDVIPQIHLPRADPRSADSQSCSAGRLPAMFGTVRQEHRTVALPYS